MSHGFQITDKGETRRLGTQDKNNIQFVITETDLLNYIKKKEESCWALDAFREGKS